MLNLDTIVNEVIAGLILSFTISLITFIFNFLKRKRKANPPLFSLKVNFYCAVIGTICSTMSLIIKDKWLPLGFIWLAFIANIAFLIMVFYEAINYEKGNS